MKVLFMGTPDFARRPLAALGKSAHDIVGVVTGQPKRTGRGKQLVPTAVAIEATRQGLKVFTPGSLRDTEFHDQVAQLRPDLIVVVAFRILPKALYTIPKFGSINIHGSLLPKYRGAAPINWALINGDKETGLSSFFLKKKVDTGDVILQTKTKIDSSENFDSLYARLSEMSGPFMLETIELIKSGKAMALPQNDSEASPAPKITPFDAMIDFGFPAEKVKDFVRGLANVPAAYTYFRDRKVKILSCRTVETNYTNIRPGSVVTGRKRLIIQCADTAIEVERLIPEGKKEMDGQSFINGLKPEPGEVFGKIIQKADHN